jgi:hypothetical protein
MNTLRKVSLVFAFAAALSSAQAFARTQSASTGRAVSAADISCFGMWYGSMTNNCSAAKSFDIPLVVDNTGSKTTTVTAYAASSANIVSCAEFAVNPEITSYWGGSYVNIPSWGTASFNVTGASVPSGGFAYVNCSMNNGGRVNGVSFNP